MYDDEHDDDEHVEDEHNDDDEMMLTLPSVALNGMFDSERREVWVTCYPDRAEFRICIPFGAKQGKQALVHGWVSSASWIRVVVTFYV